LREHDDLCHACPPRRPALGEGLEILIHPVRKQQPLGTWVRLCLLFLSIVHIQIHTHLKWGGYG
jgi:hypothetical protein